LKPELPSSQPAEAPQASTVEEPADTETYGLAWLAQASSETAIPTIAFFMAIPV
jgi:hypothetical protein